MFNHTLWKLSLGLWFVANGISCSAMAVQPGEQNVSNFQPAQIYDVNLRQIVTFQELMSQLHGVDVVYIGEAHYTPPHIDAALRVLNHLEKEGRSPTLAMEMFSWDGQEGIDRYLRHEITDQNEFLKASRWKKNWGDHYEVYRPLVEFAYNHQLPLRALNPPLSLVRQVSKKGLEKIFEDPEIREWGMETPFPVEDPEYYRVLYEQIEKCHPGLTREVYQKIYEASIFRDEGMSKVIVEALSVRKNSPRVVVSYSGAGHIQYNQPIPKRVVRRWGRPLRQVTIYLHPFDPHRPEDTQELLDERISDYLWLTPLGPDGPQSRCGD